MIKDVAHRLSIQPGTVRNQLKSIFAKTGTSGKSDLLAALLKFVIEKMKSFRPLVLTPVVFVVDHELEMRERARGFLDAKGMRVYTFEGPESALRQIPELRPDVAVVNGEMPTFVAEDFLRAIEATPRLGTSLFLVAASEGPIAPPERVPSAVLPKPLDLDQVFGLIMEQMIGAVQQRNRYQRAMETIVARINDSESAPIENIGYGGVFIAIDHLHESREFRLGSRISLSFALDEQRIEAVGEIVWRREAPLDGQPPGVGVRFTEIPTQDRETILEFVRAKKLAEMVP
jgi:DNA-binding NarL/FixJ family response regulator